MNISYNNNNNNNNINNNNNNNDNNNQVEVITYKINNEDENRNLSFKHQAFMRGIELILFLENTTLFKQRAIHTEIPFNQKKYNSRIRNMQFYF